MSTLVDTTVCAMKKYDTDVSWLFRDERNDKTGGRTNDLMRLAMKLAVEIPLRDIMEQTEDSDWDIIYDAANSLYALNAYYKTSEAVIARHEAKGEWDSFRLLHRQLAGLALEFGALTARWPEQACNRFKASRVNGVLHPLKAQMEEDMGVTLPLADEEGGQSYSDISLILRTYLDVSAAYVRRYYNGNPPVIPPVPDNWAATLIGHQILLFCLDGPRSILEIGHMLGYKDKKTIRKYLNPLLKEGLLARTVPDRPNSRNQKYITARNC